MSQFEQLVEKLRAQAARELIVLPATNPRYLSATGWLDLDAQSIAPAQSQQICLSLLTSEEKSALEQTGQVTGSVFSKKGYSVTYDVQTTWSGYSGYFQVAGQEDLSMDPSGIPEVLRQSVERRSGLILVTGPRRSGKTTVLGHLIKQMNSTQSTAIATFSDHPFFLRSSERSTLIHFSKSKLKSPSEILDRGQMANVLVIDSIGDAQTLDVCFRAAEQGKLVIGSYESMSLVTALKRIVWSFRPEMRAMAQDLLSTHLQVTTGQRLAPAEEKGGWILASEVLVNTPEVREKIANSDWDELQSIMKTRGEKTGMHSLNQSLLQMLLRRKISLQSAYELSPEVEELHAMMEKVGV